MKKPTALDNSRSIGKFIDIARGVRKVAGNNFRHFFDCLQRAFLELLLFECLPEVIANPFPLGWLDTGPEPAVGNDLDVFFREQDVNQRAEKLAQEDEDEGVRSGLGQGIRTVALQAPAGPIRGSESSAGASRRPILPGPRPGP